MENLKERQKEEALKRMKMLQIMPQVIGDFKRSNKIYYSERQSALFAATLYWLDNQPEWVKMVKEFEKKNNAMVYHAQLTHMEFGDCLALFYVSEDDEIWEQDKEDILNGEIYSRVLVLDDEWNSDYGYIGVKPMYGGVARIW